MESTFSLNDRIFRQHLPTNIPPNTNRTQETLTPNVRIIPPRSHSQIFPPFQLTQIQRRTIESLHTKYYLEHPSIPCSQCCILLLPRQVSWKCPALGYEYPVSRK